MPSCLQAGAAPCFDTPKRVKGESSLVSLLACSHTQHNVHDSSHKVGGHPAREEGEEPIRLQT